MPSHEEEERPPISDMTLEEAAAELSRVVSELLQGKITPKEARTIDRAVGRRLKVIEGEEGSER